MLLRAILISQFAWAGTDILNPGARKTEIDTLSPGLNLHFDNFKKVFSLTSERGVFSQGVLPFREIDKTELLTRKYSKSDFYNISNADFVQGLNSGYWQLKSPFQDIFQSCTCIVFIDKKGDISLAHLNIDPLKKADLENVTSEWAAYAGTDELGNIIPAFDEANLFSARTKAIIVSRSPDTVLAKQIRDFLFEKGLELENIYLDPAPRTAKNDTAGIFIHPANQVLRITYAGSSEEKTQYQITEVHEYSLDDISAGALKLNPRKNVIQKEFQGKIIAAGDLKEILNKIGFNYAEKLSPEFKLPFENKHGQLKTLLVTKGGEHAFALRETLHYGRGRGVTFRMINLMEINPFLGDFGKEDKNGYCQFAIDVKQKEAGLSLNNDTIIKTYYHRNNGLASAMLSLAISLAEEAGMKKITVYNVIDHRAKSLYIKLGFVPVSSGTMVIDLEHKPEPNFDGTGSWLMKDVAKHRKFRFVDFRAKTADELLDNSQSNIKERLLSNDLIQIFFKFEKNKAFGNPFYPSIKKILNREDKIIKEVIGEVEAMREIQVEAEGKEILEDFNNMPANEKAEKVHTWTEFVEQPTMGEYDLTQIFAYSINMAQGWLQLLELDADYEFIAKAKKGFRENFRKGYVVLRAIEIESRTNFEKDEKVTDIELDEAIFKVLDGVVIKNKFGAEYEIEYSPQTGRADIIRMKDGEFVGYGIFYLQDKGRELFINDIEMEKQKQERNSGLATEFLRAVIDLIPEGFRTTQVVVEEGSRVYLDNLYKKYGTDENGELLNYDPHANLLGHFYFKSGLQRQKVIVRHANDGTYFFKLIAWKEKAKINHGLRISKKRAEEGITKFSVMFEKLEGKQTDFIGQSI